MRFPVLFHTALALLCLLSPTTLAQPEKPEKLKPKFEDLLPDSWTRTLKWRCLGPASMGGRIVDFAVYEKDPSIWWVATASGGLLKTTNNGTTFEHQFDHENTVSIGDVAVSQSNPKILYVGTGEHNPRNSVSYGDGVYKSVDGGKSWKNVGLKKTFQIGRIAIHPTNPDIVYVGALGRLYGPNEERGIFKSIDGGKTWQKVLYLDDKTGVIDVQMNPKNPEELLIAAWEVRRDAFDAHQGSPTKNGYNTYDPSVKWGPKSGIYKTTDGGVNWKKLTKGLPTCDLGRIGINYYRKNPNVVFAIVDSAKIGLGTPPPPTYLGVRGNNAEEGARLTQVVPEGPAAKSGLKNGDIVTAINKKPIKNYQELLARVSERKPGDVLEFTILRDKEKKDLEVTLGKRALGGYLGLTGTNTDDGLKITIVVKDGPSEEAGVKVGDLLQTLDETKVKTIQDVQRFVKSKDAKDVVTLTLLRDEKQLKVKVTLDKTPAQKAARPWGAYFGGQRENVQRRQGDDSYEYGGVYKSTDGGETWERINSLNPRPMYFSQIRVDPSDEKYVYVLGVSLHRSTNGGVTFKPDGGSQVHPDQHALWIDPNNGKHLIVGTDGGFYATYDRMNHWDHFAQAALAQYYHVAVDHRKPYRVYGGLQDNGSWGGPSHSRTGRGIANYEWFMLGGGDGFICRVDAEDQDLVYWESQDGNIRRRNQRTGKGGFLKPQPPRGKPPYRFNWQTPYILSNENSRIVYVGGNYVFRSLNRGEKPKIISPEITRTPQGSATALAQSPRNPDVLYVGTDDGYLWVTRDGGEKWTNVTEKVGLPGPRWVNSIEPSHHIDGRVYVVFDGHRSDDDEPYVYVSEDFGASWKSLQANLPTGSTRVLREDPDNSLMLFLGTEFFIYASLNRGKSWSKINNNLPTVAIHEIALQTEADEMVVATHGRSLWILDVSALRQIKPSYLEEEVKLYKPANAIQWNRVPFRGTIYGMGHRVFLGEDPYSGASIYYSLTKPAKDVRVKIFDVSGKSIREIKCKPKVGLNRQDWNLTKLSFREVRGRGRRQPFNEPVAPGAYRVQLIVDGKEHDTTIQVEADPGTK